LAAAISDRHPLFTKNRVTPCVLGDGLRLSNILAMEVVSKLFYLDDFEHEIQERSTSVEHQKLSNLLLLAIGDRALIEGRGEVLTQSAPSKSFRELWRRYKVRVKGLTNAATTELSVPESHTRVIAYRMSDKHRQLPLLRFTSITACPRTLREPQVGLGPFVTRRAWRTITSGGRTHPLGL